MSTQRRLDRVKLKVNGVYTTGQIARICMVAPRTVSKWFDTGKLKGYRIPGSQDRRVPHKCLVEFLVTNRLTDILHKLQAKERIALLGCSDKLVAWVIELYCDSHSILSVDDMFTAGLEMIDPPEVTIIDSNSVEWSCVRAITKFLSEQGVPSIVLTREDATPDRWNLDTATCCIQHPVNLSRLNTVIASLLGGGLDTLTQPTHSDSATPSTSTLPQHSEDDTNADTGSSGDEAPGSVHLLGQGETSDIPQEAEGVGTSVD